MITAKDVATIVESICREHGVDGAMFDRSMANAENPHDTRIRYQLVTDAGTYYVLDMPDRPTGRHPSVYLRRKEEPGRWYEPIEMCAHASWTDAWNGVRAYLAYCCSRFAA